MSTKNKEILMNIRCQTLSDFRWYKDTFLSKLYQLDNCTQTFWNERFISGLPKLFGEKVKQKLKDFYGTLDYNHFTFGQIIQTINMTALLICSDMKL